MKKTSETDDWLRPEYDLSKLTVVGRGRGRTKPGSKTVSLAPDVAEVFPTSDAVNEALRMLVRVARETKIERGE